MGPAIHILINAGNIHNGNNYEFRRNRETLVRDPIVIAKTRKISHQKEVKRNRPNYLFDL